MDAPTVTQFGVLSEPLTGHHEQASEGGDDEEPLRHGDWTATAPAMARSTKPAATVTRSKIGCCLR